MNWKNIKAHIGFVSSITDPYGEVCMTYQSEVNSLRNEEDAIDVVKGIHQLRTHRFHTNILYE